MTTAAFELGVRLGELTLANPVLTAAGCGGTGPDLARFVDLTSLGAFTTRTITLDGEAGPAGVRHVETPSGWLTDTGLDNPGLHAFLATELPALAQANVRTVVSIAARSLGAYGELARRAGGSPGVVALEIALLDDDPYAAGKTVAVVRRDTPRGVGVLAKLRPGGALLDVAREAARSGADALVVGHAPIGLALDPLTLAPILRGGLSGPATAALALEAVWKVHEAVPDVPLVGVGGISTGADALAMLAAGATAVQVGSALLHDPSAPQRILSELAAELSARQLTIADVVGVAHRGPLAEAG